MEEMYFNMAVFSSWLELLDEWGPTHLAPSSSNRDLIIFIFVTVAACVINGAWLLELHCLALAALLTSSELVSWSLLLRLTCLLPEHSYGRHMSTRSPRELSYCHLVRADE